MSRLKKIDLHVAKQLAEQRELKRLRELTPKPMTNGERAALAALGKRLRELPRRDPREVDFRRRTRP